jgi:hypothetical protein
MVGKDGIKGSVALDATEAEVLQQAESQDCHNDASALCWWLIGGVLFAVHIGVDEDPRELGETRCNAWNLR